MSNIIFTKEQQEHLIKNPWAKNVTEKSIMFTEEFKVYFLNEYNLLHVTISDGIAFFIDSILDELIYKLCSNILLPLSAFKLK